MARLSSSSLVICCWLLLARYSFADDYEDASSEAGPTPGPDPESAEVTEHPQSKLPETPESGEVVSRSVGNTEESAGSARADDSAEAPGPAELEHDSAQGPAPDEPELEDPELEAGPDPESETGPDPEPEPEVNAAPKSPQTPKTPKGPKTKPPHSAAPTPENPQQPKKTIKLGKCKGRLYESTIYEGATMLAESKMRRSAPNAIACAKMCFQYKRTKLPGPCHRVSYEKPFCEYQTAGSEAAEPEDDPTKYVHDPKKATHVYIDYTSKKH